MALEEPPGQQPRGVFNPHVVDLISHDEASGEVVLLMLEERAWGAAPEQLRQLQDKFNSYLSYVLGGHLVKQYPDYEGKAVCFQLDCLENPPAEHRNFFTAMGNYASAEGIRLVISVIAPTTS